MLRRPTSSLSAASRRLIHERHVVGAGILATIGLLFFAAVVAALAMRGVRVSPTVAERFALLTAAAPYAIVLAVLHGLIAYFAASAYDRVRSFAMWFAASGAVIGLAIAVGIALHILRFEGSWPGPGWDAVAGLVLLASAYAVASALLMGSERR